MAETYSAEHLKSFYADSLAILEIMERLNKDVTPSFLGKRFYTDAQLSEILNISRRTLQEYRDNRLIAYYRLDGKILYADDDVDKFLRASYRAKYC